MCSEFVYIYGVILMKLSRMLTYQIQNNNLNLNFSTTVMALISALLNQMQIFSTALQDIKIQRFFSAVFIQIFFVEILLNCPKENRRK